MKQSEIITPFITSVKELFSTMLNANKVERGKVGFADNHSLENELTGIIGMSGPDRGTVAVSFPEQTALKVVSAFMGMEMTEVDDDVLDAVAEVVNIISGGAKPHLPHDPSNPIQLGLPTVVTGREYTVQAPADAVWLEIPFETGLGGFTLRVSFESMKRN